MPTLGAYVIAKNEEALLAGCIDRLLPYVDQLVLVDHNCTDGTVAIMEKYERENPKKVIHVGAIMEGRIDMGALRSDCYKQMTTDWVLNVDADEYYPPAAMATIKAAVQTAQADGPISFRVKYHNLSWRGGWRQSQFTHTPDRVYRRDVVDFVGGVLPNDMHNVKREFYTHNPVLEYDNPQDQSFENPRQPILDAWYYHLARTRGYNFEYEKWLRYQKNLHPEITDVEADRLARLNQWVSGMYISERMDRIDPHPVKPPADIPLLSVPQPKVSIVISNYNYSAYVAEAIESALNQTVKPFEVIVVDDGSTDNSLEIIQRYPVILHRHTQNQGVATARNGGIALSKGDHFLCLDADDRLAPQALEEMLKAMQGDVQVVYPNLRFIGEQEGVWDAPEPSREAMRAWQIVPSVCALVDRHCFSPSGGFDPGLIYEDWGFWLNLMIEHQFNFAHVPGYLLEYRKHGPSRVTENDKQQALGFQQLRDRYGITRQPDPKG